MTSRGMDVDGVDALVGRLQIQAEIINGIVGVVDGAVAALTKVWFGENLNVFHGAWTGGQRAQANDVVADIAAVVRSLRAEVIHQRTASDGQGGLVTGSSRAVSAEASPADLLAFAKDAERLSHVFLGEAKGERRRSLPAGWQVATPAQLHRLEIDPSSLHDPNTGFDATIYSNGHGGYVVSFAGSDGSLTDPNNKDWYAPGGDVVAIVDSPQESRQVEQAADLAAQMKAAVGQQNVVFTGHSLGGREAVVASVVTGSRAVAFNPTGTTTSDLIYANALAGRSEGLAGMIEDVATFGAASYVSAQNAANVTNYVISDEVARATHLVASQQYIGPVNAVPTDALDPIKAHSLDEFEGKL